jgi:hypothetical protein
MRAFTIGKTDLEQPTARSVTNVAHHQPMHNLVPQPARTATTIVATTIVRLWVNVPWLFLSSLSLPSPVRSIDCGTGIGIGTGDPVPKTVSSA